MAGNPNFNTLVSTTLDNYMAELTDIIFTSRPLMWIMKNEGLMGNKDGGRTCVVPLLVASSKNIGSYSGSDVFSTDDDDEISAAQYNWKQYYGLIKIDGITKAKNAGKSAVLDILEERLGIVKESMIENLDAIFLGDGSGNGGKDFSGLKAIVSDADPSVGALGGLAVATNPNWQSPHNNTSQAWSAYGLAGMAKSFNDASEGNDHPTHILTYQAAYEAYEASLTDNARYLDPEVADAGFQNLLFKGVPIVFDRYVEDGNDAAGGRIYFLNKKYLKFYTLGGTWFEPSDLVAPANQDVVYKYYKTYGEFTTNNRKRHALKSGLTDV